MDRTELTETEIKEAVRNRYAAAVAKPGNSCCGPAATQPLAIGSSCCGPAVTETMKGSLVKTAGYGEEELGRLPADAVQNSFGCGNPLAFAGVQPGQVVLDIGSGAGIDCLIAAEKVGPTGRVIGLDMTPEMIERGRGNAREAGALAYLVKPFPDKIMPQDFGKKLNAAALNKIIDYLSQLEEGKEPPKIK